MPATLTLEDLAAIDALIERRISAVVPSVVVPVITFRLTPRQFACCVQRSEIYIQRQCRCRNIKAEGPPWLIHASALAAFNVDHSLAVARLKAAGLFPPASSPAQG